MAALACLLLGGRHLLETCGNRLDVEQSGVGVPIRARVRYFRVLGPPECELEIEYETADGSQFSDGTVGSTFGNRVRRTWLCFYSMEHEFDPVDRPCRLIVYARQHDWFTEDPFSEDGTVRTLRERIVDVK